MDHPEVIALIISYTLVGAFVITVLLTLASLIGIIKFADQAQQRKLFAVLIVEMVAVCMAVFTGYVNLSPKDTVESIESKVEQQNVATAQVLEAINTRAILTLTSGEFSLDDMFSSIGHSLIEVKKSVHKIHSGQQQRLALDIQDLLEEILTYRSTLESTGIAYHASDEQKKIHKEIDADKLLIINKARALSKLSKHSICLPEHLEMGYFGSPESASSPPACANGL